MSNALRRPLALLAGFLLAGGCTFRLDLGRDGIGLLLEGELPEILLRFGGEERQADGGFTPITVDLDSLCLTSPLGCP